MTVPLGLDAKAYAFLDDADNPTAFGAFTAWPLSGVPAGAELVELVDITNVTLNLSKGTTDITRRGGGGWRERRAHLREGTITSELMYDTENNVTKFLIEAFFTQPSPVYPLAFLDGDANVPGTRGLWALFDISVFNKEEQLEDAQRIPLEFIITASTPAAAWITVGA